MNRARLFLGALALTLAIGCGSPSPVGLRGTNKLISVPLGSNVRITLQNIGPGEYAAPPVVSAPVVQFESVAVVGPFVPAGVTQEFRFHAVARGRAIVTFTHTDDQRTAEDTIVVR